MDYSSNHVTAEDVASVCSLVTFCHPNRLRSVHDQHTLLSNGSNCSDHVYGHTDYLSTRPSASRARLRSVITASPPPRAHVSISLQRSRTTTHCVRSTVQHPSGRSGYTGSTRLSNGQDVTSCARAWARVFWVPTTDRVRSKDRQQ